MRSLGVMLVAAAVSVAGLLVATAESPSAFASPTGATQSAVEISTSTTMSLFSFGSMAPGEMVTRQLAVSNRGSQTLRYALTSTTTEDTLAAQLDLTVRVGVSDCDDTGFALDGVVLYEPDDLGSTARADVIGNPAYGDQPGDRTLAPGASETLCLQVSLPLSTGNEFQGLSTAAAFDFIAEPVEVS